MYCRVEGNKMIRSLSVLKLKQLYNSLIITQWGSNVNP